MLSCVCLLTDVVGGKNGPLKATNAWFRVAPTEIRLHAKQRVAMETVNRGRILRFVLMIVEIRVEMAFALGSKDQRPVRKIVFRVNQTVMDGNVDQTAVGDHAGNVVMG